MAKIEFFDAAEAVTQEPLLGESGHLPTDALFGLSDSKSVWADNGSVLTQSIYVGSELRYVAKYSYSFVASPSVDKRISRVTLYNRRRIQTYRELSN